LGMWMPGEAMSMLRVIVADDDPFVRRLIKDALQAEDVRVIAEARTGREALELTLHYRPDAVLMDIVMPELDGISATRQILASAPDQTVLLITGSEEEDMALLSLRAGATGFVTKDLPAEALARVVHAAVRGEAVLSRAQTTQLFEYLRTMPERQAGMRPVKSPLTNREWEVVVLLADGRSNAEIAGTMFVSIATVRSHIQSILRKLGVGSRQEAVAAAERMRKGA
jgi:two-component system, NarL family, response regulator LiaR